MYERKIAIERVDRQRERERERERERGSKLVAVIKGGNLIRSNVSFNFVHKGGLTGFSL